ncbi:pentatricopeptide repeat-containing protein At1g03560, mitochondrial-like [Vigna umbellata]|uniref:pentatricopeptide repeat-containing protein At1g03560, mitochondrial-like n=1 Tax=Vigna umbellata TaxID=87088 RepID=UPI001F5F7E31|nr:pentatricopeptide repeat-containing protein At1g03560, mitochondrial-like [Vigna umbellata]XP_047172714.1 pentatricopeptide repeat-containing protein At1g03560, mitochondrial-like [Vigna umbellata]
MRRVALALLKRVYPSRSHNARRSFSTLLPPPREVVEPFCNLSDVVSSPQTSPWVSQIISLLDGSPSMESNLDSFCRQYLVSLSPAFVSHTLRSLSDPLTATRFFSWAATQPNYTHSLDCHVSLLPLLPPSSLPAAVDSLRRANLPITLPAAHSLAKTLAAAGLIHDLLWLFRAMTTNNLPLSLIILNSLLNALVNASLVESAERVFKSMQEGASPKPDVVSYNTLVKGYCKVGRTRDAFATLREMEAENVPPDEATYMTLMQACYNEGDMDSCVRLYHEMEEDEVLVTKIPSHAYSLTICGLCKQGKVVEGCFVFESMIKKGCVAHKAVYTAMIDGYAKSGNMDAALSFLERMKVDGVEPDEVTYGAVVGGLCKSGKVEEAMSYFRFCKGNEVGVNAVFYSSLIDGLGKVGRVDEAERLFEEMAEVGCPPDSYCYNALMDGLCKSGRVDEALMLFRRMEQEGCEQTIYTFTILISELFKERRNEEALKLWEEMIDKGVTPNAACFRALSIGLCLSGKVARACRVLDELAPMGIVLERAYEDMIGVLCKAGRVKEACKLADGIVDRGREIPGKVRTVLINALRKAGNADLAIKLMHSKIGIGYDRMRSVKKRVKFQTLVNS